MNDSDGAASLITQFGVLPFRLDEEQGVQILLVTSRETGRWLIPKGNPIPLLRGPGTARREAYEEAGIEGPLSDAPIGRYIYRKRRRSGETVAAQVTVYAMRVVRQLDDWPERSARVTRWYEPADAALAVDEPELKALILGFRPAATGYRETESKTRLLKRYWIVALPAAGLIAAAGYVLTRLF